MSIALMNLAWDREGITSGAKFVLVSLADQANDVGTCFPSIKTIARRTSLSVRAVQAHITALETAGIVKRIERRGHSTLYKILLKNAPTPADSAPPMEKEVDKKVDAPEAAETKGCSGYEIPDPCKICTPAEFAPPQILHPTPADSAPPPPQILHPTPADSAPITTTEPKGEPKANLKETTTTPNFIPRGFVPNQDCVGLLQDEGVSISFIDSYLPEFVLFWQESGAMKPGWNTVFYRQCLQSYRQAAGAMEMA